VPQRAVETEFVAAALQINLSTQQQMVVVLAGFLGKAILFVPVSLNRGRPAVVIRQVEPGVGLIS
jgi:hypothetical protein